ncbi:MAG: LPXTG cell wall anchor domain-containing protein [Nitriliruptorales bacterium]|nr:LPXTG cell wall anchor domain-containing protein [Nitriliruptorales bacterium]
MRTARRGLALLAIVAMLLVLVAGVAAAQQVESDTSYTPGEEADGQAACPATTVQGRDNTCVAGGFEPGTEVLAEAFIQGEKIAEDTLVANEGGRVRFTFEVPCTALRGQEGEARFTGTDENGEQLVVSADFTVGGEVPACPEGTATTGINLTNGMTTAAVALIAGALLVGVARRRSDDTASETVES